MASASFSPISRSLLAATLPTWVISSFLFLTEIDMALSLSVTSATARSIPSFNWMGLTPETTARRPSLKMASASSVAVVVPSPATSLVLLATSRTIRAPMFS